jgi:hypothetical protein
VVVSPLPLIDLLDGLRAAGFSPAGEDSGGAVLDLTHRGRRTAPRRRPSGRGGAPPEPDPEQLVGLVSRMRAGDALNQVRRGSAHSAGGNGSAVDLLRSAAASQRRLVIGFVDRRGDAAEVVLAPVNVGGGVVEGRDAVDGVPVRVPLHRITTIAEVEQ